MLSVFRVATPVTGFKRSSPPLQLSPYSPLCKRTTFAAVISDAQTTPSDLPVAICSLKELKALAAGIQQLPLLTRPLPVLHDISSNTGDSTANSDTCPPPVVYQSSSCFPVHGPFDLLQCVQNGAFGSAWAARDKCTGRLLCLKVFQSVQEPDMSRSVRMELRIFRRMVKSREGERGKQFIIELNRSIQHGTTVFFAMELMTTDLGIYLATNPERCEVHTRQWMAQIALGIQALHEMGIIHRDIKSENILIDSRENVRIIDFGLSYLDPTGKPLCKDTTYAAEFLGTPSYMAPEVLRNKEVPYHRRRRYGIAVDWWALGCILFELESRSHQILFDTEQDVHTYVTWTQRTSQLEQTYSRFENFNPVVISLLDGLLRVQPSVRYALSDMEKHDYFLHRDGTSEFDNAAARALENPIRSELVPQFRDDEEPMKVIEVASPSSVFDWTNMKWASPADS